MKKIQDIREKRTEDRSWKTEESRPEKLGFDYGRFSIRYAQQSQLQSQLAAPTGRQVIAQGEALCNNAPTTPIAPRLNIIQGDEFAWGKTNNKNKENIEYRMMINECRSIEKSEVRSRESEALKERQAIAQCEALGSNAPTNLLAPRSITNYSDTIAWGKKENVEYRMSNNECRNIEKSEVRSRESEERFQAEEQFPLESTQFPVSEESFPLELNSFHWSEALLPHDCIVWFNKQERDTIAHQQGGSVANYGDTIAWGKTNNENKENVEYRISNNEYRSEDLEALKSLSQPAPINRGFVGRQNISARKVFCTTLSPIGTFPKLGKAVLNNHSINNNNHYFNVFPSRGENPEGKRGRAKNKLIQIVYRFRVGLGMTERTTLLAVLNRLAHNNKYRNKEEKPGLRLSKVEETLSDLGKSDSQKNDNSICQRTDEKFSITIFIYNSTIIMEFFSFSLRQLTEDRREASYNIYLN